MKRVVVGRGSPRLGAGRGEPHPTARQSDDMPDDLTEDRAILSFTLLLATLLAGFVISLGLAETNPVLTTLVSILN